MPTSTNLSSLTTRIIIPNPTKDDLEEYFLGQELSVQLVAFLKRVVCQYKGTRKINIPSSHRNVAAVLLISSRLTETSLEVSDELHVFFDGQVAVESWKLRPKAATNSSGEEPFTMLDLDKVRVEGTLVRVTLEAMVQGEMKAFVREFQFPCEEGSRRVISHPVFA